MSLAGQPLGFALENTASELLEDFLSRLTHALRSESHSHIIWSLKIRCAAIQEPQPLGKWNASPGAERGLGSIHSNFEV